MYKKKPFLVISFFLQMTQLTFVMENQNELDKSYVIIKKIANPNGTITISKNNIMAIASYNTRGWNKASYKTLELFDLNTQTTILEEPLSGYWFNSTSFNRDGTLLACAQHNGPDSTKIGSIKIYNTETGKIIFTKECPVNEKNTVVFHPTNDNLFLSHVFSGLAPSIPSTLSIHSINKPHLAFKTEIHSTDKHESYNDNQRSIVCHPNKNNISLIINNIWHTIDDCFLTEEKIFLINELLTKNGCLPELNRFILKFIMAPQVTNNKPEKDFERLAPSISTEYSPSGDYIAKICEYRKYDLIAVDNTVTNSRKYFKLSPTPLTYHRKIAFHPNNEIFAVIENKTLQYRSIINGEQISLPTTLNFDTTNHIHIDMTFSHDGRDIYLAYEGKLIRISVPENVINFKYNPIAYAVQPVRIQSTPLYSQLCSTIKNPVFIGTLAIGFGSIIAAYLWNHDRHPSKT